MFIFYIILLIFNSLMLLAFEESSISLFLTINLCLFFFKKINTKHGLTISVIYNITTFLGLLYVNNYYSNYQGFYAPYGDDSFFVLEAQDLIASNSINLFKPFETFLAICIQFLESTFGYTFLNLLTIYWVLSSFFVYQLLKLVDDYLPSSFSFMDVLCIVFFNYIFVDILVHIYRDSMLYLFFVIALRIYYNNKNNLNALNLGLIFITVIFVFFLRGSNGLLLILFLLMDYYLYSRNMISKTNYRTYFKQNLIKLVSLIVVFLLFSASLTDYVSRIGNTSSDQGQVSLLELGEKRQEDFFENLDESQNTVIVYKLGIIGYPLRIISQVFSPLSFKPFVSNNFRVSQKVKGFILPIYTDYTIILYSLTIFMWIYLAPRLSIGIYRSYAEIKNQPILLMTIISIILVAFVSLQARHRLMFMVFYPFFLSFYNSKKKTINENKIFNKIQIATTFIVIFSCLIFLI